MGKGGKGKDKKGNNSQSVKIFLPYCPAFDLCTKGQAHLGRCWSHDEAFNKLMNHLINSPFHSLNEAEAREAIEGTPECITEHEEQWEEQAQQAQEPEQQANARKRKAIEAGSSGAQAAAHAVAQLQAHSHEQLRAAYSFVKAFQPSCLS